jgi:hypothetical protein
VKLTLKVLAAGAILAGAPHVASASPADAGLQLRGLGGQATRVHGDHRSCQRRSGEWHRHNRYGERRSCRPWHGKGRRPEACVKFGPIWYCDY